jgi:thioredoxin reductase
VSTREFLGSAEVDRTTTTTVGEWPTGRDECAGNWDDHRMDELHDVAIVGGGAAGLSAALVLGRARRTVALFDAGEQNNRAAARVGGLFGHDQKPPAELYATARTQLVPYATVAVHETTVTSIRRAGGGFVATTADGAATHARLVLLATGMRYELPDVPGVAELWGDTVFHCPFCHGWEVREERLAAFGSGDDVVERALLLRAWSDDVVLLANGRELGDDAAARLDQAGITVDARPVAEVRDREGSAAAVVFADGGVLERDALLVSPTLTQRTAFAAELGVELTGPGTIAVDGLGRTSVDGVFAAGDVAQPMQQVVIAAAAGATAAIAIVRELTVA